MQNWIAVKMDSNVNKNINSQNSLKCFCPDKVDKKKLFPSVCRSILRNFKRLHHYEDDSFECRLLSRESLTTKKGKRK